MNQSSDIEQKFFRSNLLKLARAGFALVARWGRFFLRRSLPRLILSSPRAFKTELLDLTD